MTFVLFLNDMRSAHAEDLQPVARAETREEIESHLFRELRAPYDDGQWRKRFRQGGPLEWYNPPHSEDFIRDVGTEASQIAQAVRLWQERIMSLPEIRLTSTSPIT